LDADWTPKKAFNTEHRGPTAAGIDGTPRAQSTAARQAGPRGAGLCGLIQESAWVAKHENVFVCGPTGVGKSYLACALAHKACRDGYSAFYARAATLFRDLALARADGSLRSLLLRLSKIDVLVVDDWAMAPLSETERRDFWEICEDRYQARSLILASQLPVAKWHEQIGDPTIAEGILDRIVHHAHRIDLRGESLRKNPPKTER
jgi:DNA replication protein DnaC